MLGPLSVNGTQTIVDVVGAGGGTAGMMGFEIQTSPVNVNGIWILFSLSGDAFDPGYYQLVELEMESLSALNCEPSSFGFVNVTIASVADAEVWRTKTSDGEGNGDLYY